jgi:hypothetical protein
MPASSSSSSRPPVSNKRPSIPYKHIYYRKTKNQEGYIVQYQKKTHGGFQTYAQACSTLKALLGYLPRKNSKLVVSKTKKPYFGVSFHKTLKRWVGNRESIGTHATAEEAHRALTRKRPAAKNKRARTRAKVQLKQLALRAKKFMQWAETGKTQFLPPDLMAASRHAITSGPMFKAERALEMLSLHLKYEPWKHALLESWKQLGRPTPAPDATLTQRAEVVLSVAKKAATVVAKSPVQPEWPANANRMRHREQGPTITLRNLGIVRS